MKDKICNICTYKRKLITLPMCSHEMCEKCWYTIKKMSIHKAKCPFCRRPEPDTYRCKCIQLIKNMNIVNLFFVFYCVYYIYRHQNI